VCGPCLIQLPTNRFSQDHHYYYYHPKQEQKKRHQTIRKRKSQENFTLKIMTLYYRALLYPTFLYTPKTKLYANRQTKRITEK